MILTREEKTQLLKRFPPLELSYENILHKKVSADVYMLIPAGQKAFAWFTYWLDKNVCFLLLLNEKNNIYDIKHYPLCFDSCLALNTVVYGTLFRNNNLAHFACEQLFYYKNTQVDHYNLVQKLELLQELFTVHVKQVAYTTDFLILGLPIIKTNYDHALACINGLAYKIYGIQMMCNTSMCNTSMCNSNSNQIIGIYKFNKPSFPEAIFHVKALFGADIYELYTLDQEAPYGTAMIPSYKCSVMMNSLFRHIKENVNLDLLEESDDEEEYENTQADKFVNLEQTYPMRCVYMRKFRKWQPVEVVDAKVKVCSAKEAHLLEN
jgi:hypothetical protein